MTAFQQQLALKLLLIPISACAQFAAVYLLPVRWLSSHQLQSRHPVTVAACGLAAGVLCSASLLDLFATGSAEFEDALGRRGTRLRELLSDFSVSSFLLLCGFIALLSLDQLLLFGGTLSQGGRNDSLVVFGLGSRSVSGVSTNSRSRLREDWAADGSELERLPIVDANIIVAGNDVDNADGDCGSSSIQPGTASSAVSRHGIGWYGTNKSSSRRNNSDVSDTEDFLDEVQLNQPALEFDSATSDAQEEDVQSQLAQSRLSLNRRRNCTDRRRLKFLSGALCCCLCIHAALAGWRLGADWESTTAQLGSRFLMLPLHEAAIAASAGLQFAMACRSIEDLGATPMAACCCNDRAAVVISGLAVSLAEPLGLVFGLATSTIAALEDWPDWIRLIRAAVLSLNAGAFLFIVFLHVLPGLLSKLDFESAESTCTNQVVLMMTFFILGGSLIVLSNFLALVF